MSNFDIQNFTQVEIAVVTLRKHISANIKDMPAETAYALGTLIGFVESQLTNKKEQG